MIPKFRAWDKHGQKMFSEAELIIWNNNVYANDSKKLSCNHLIGWSIDEEYLMQSTGLLDKNGTEIFEGDVLQIDFIKAIVRFGQYRYYDNAGKDVLTGNGFYLECLNVIDPDCISPYETDVLDKTEIIGNIYENPEYDQNFIGFRIKGE